MNILSLKFDKLKRIYFSKRRISVSYFSSQVPITLDVEIDKRLDDIFNANITNQLDIVPSKKVIKRKIFKQIYVYTMDNGSVTLEIFKDLIKHLMLEASKLKNNYEYIFNIYIVLPEKIRIYRSIEDEPIVKNVTDVVNKLHDIMKRLSHFPKASKFQSHLKFINGILENWRIAINYTSDDSKLAKNITTKISQSWAQHCLPLFDTSIETKLNIFYKKFAFIKTEDIIKDAHFINISRDDLIKTAEKAKDNYNAKRGREKPAKKDSKTKSKNSKSTKSELDESKSVSKESTTKPVNSSL